MHKDFQDKEKLNQFIKKVEVINIETKQPEKRNRYARKPAEISRVHYKKSNYGK
jgi:hypothetical protein